jgi:iron complex transport system ATP-binding protein
VIQREFFRLDAFRLFSIVGSVPGKQKVIELDGITVDRDVRILTDVAWDVRSGEHWAILGANGSGKTSLLSVLAGYLTPSDGMVRVCGQTYGEVDWREVRKRFGVVSSTVRQAIEPCEPADEIVISGREAVINYWGIPSSAEKRRARRILREVEGLHLVDRPWGVLSQGERQRVLIGRALMADLQLLILDEPCAGLDPVARETFLGFVNRLVRRPGAPTVLLVTHHVEEIPPAFSHVLVLKKGRVLVAGRKADVLRSDLLSEAFGEKVKVSRSRGRYSMSVRVTSDRVA